MMKDQSRAPDGEHDTPVSRRSLLKVSGSALATAAVVHFTGVPRAHAPTTSPKPRRENLRAVDPHASTARRAPGSARVRGVAIRGEETRLTILPIDRAKFLVGGRFDLRVEVSDVDPIGAEIEIRVEGPDGPAAVLHDEPERTSSEEDSLEVTYHGLAYPAPGTYTVTAELRANGRNDTAEVAHEVVTADTSGERARNIIFCLGDGMGQPAITAARLLSKGMRQGKYDGLLEMDTMQYRGVVGTSGIESIATDSANSMSSYMTGHKSASGAMGVYPSNEPDPNRHPRVETIAELLKRAAGMAIGIATTSEIQDATPAAVFAHTRERGEYLDIMEQSLTDEQRPDVFLGGGSASLLPRSEAGSSRTDDRDLREEYQDLGYTYVDTGSALRELRDRGVPQQLFGTFHTGNLDVFLDRSHPQSRRDDLDFPDQPTLVEMTEVALAALEGREEGFFLMIEGASIDKMAHPQDGPRVVYDTIEFDQAIGVAKRWAEDRDDTLVVVTADHNHSMSIVGTHDRRDDPSPDREGNGVYGDAGFPTYEDADGDGYPDDPDPEVQLFFGWSNHPDHTDDFQHNEEFDQPALLDANERAVDNPDRDPDALEQIGNLPYDQINCVHTVEDVAVGASGPGAARFNAFLDNTEIFFALADALHLSVPVPEQPERDPIGGLIEETPLGEPAMASPGDLLDQHPNGRRRPLRPQRV
jgi:alkaline phosphatase